MEIVVFGAGSLGSLLGAKFATAHEVTLVGRNPHMAAVNENGLRVTGLDTFVTHPAATTDGTDLAADLAVVTVKAFDTKTAARELATGSYDAVLSLQNGMGNEDGLAESLDCPVLAGTTTFGARRREPGVVEWTGEGDVVLGPWAPPVTPAVDRVADAFRSAGFDTSVAANIRTKLWEKLAVNAAINPVTALARVENGALADGELHGIARDAAAETARVARAIGADLREGAAVDRTEAVIEATAPNHSSMLQDVMAGRRTEIDAITGYVIERAAANAVDVPVNRTLFALVKGWERGQGVTAED